LRKSERVRERGVGYRKLVCEWLQKNIEGVCNGKVSTKWERKGDSCF
jgi:hypothetical protein